MIFGPEAMPGAFGKERPIPMRSETYAGYLAHGNETYLKAIWAYNRRVRVLEEIV